MTLTFLLSACVHELVMVIVTKKFRYAPVDVYSGRGLKLMCHIQNVSFYPSARPNSHDSRQPHTGREAQ